MTNWDAVHTECPFYVTENKFSITCEGLIDNKTTTHNFVRQAEKKQYKCLYCNSSETHKYCEHYYSLMHTRYTD